MILDQFRLDGKVALITGGSRGLGLGMAAALAEAGADIISIQHTSHSGALAERVTGMVIGRCAREHVGDRLLSVTHRGAQKCDQPG